MQELTEQGGKRVTWRVARLDEMSLSGLVVNKTRISQTFSRFDNEGEKCSWVHGSMMDGRKRYEIGCVSRDVRLMKGPRIASGLA